METMRVLVVHPELGSIVVQAYCRIDAQLQAAMQWDISLDEVMEKCRLGLEPEVLARLRREGA